MQPVDADELHVRSLGEAGVSFDARAETLQFAALRLAADDRVRVANGDRREFHALVAQVERLGLPHLDTSDVDFDPLAVANDRLDVARADRQRHLLGLRLARKPRRDDSHAVAGQLGCRAVRIPDPHLGVRPFHLQYLKQTVGSDAVVVVAEVPDTIRRQRFWKLSPYDQQVVVAERLPLRQCHV